MGPDDLSYAVHTATCSYLLDDEGVCRWLVSPKGAAPRHVRLAIGAQFVACLDLAAPGGLVGELSVGAMALFVRTEQDRMILLRTGTIQQVDDRRNSAEPTTRRANRRAPAVAPPGPERAYGKAGGVPYGAVPPPRLSVVDHRGSEATITITRPTGRGPASTPSPPKRVDGDPASVPSDQPTRPRRP